MHEIQASGSAAVAASACAACFESYGMDPSFSAVFAVMLGVVVRLAVDVWRERRMADGQAKDQ